jgi:hypothetical protein
VPATLAPTLQSRPGMKAKLTNATQAHPLTLNKETVRQIGVTTGVRTGMKKAGGTTSTGYGCLTFDWFFGCCC